MMPQGVADVVKPDGMGQLRKEQTAHMTPWREGARLFIDPVLPGEFFRQMRPDEFTKLMQGAAVVFGRRYVFHAADSLVGIAADHLFLTLPERESHHILWDGCVVIKGLLGCMVKLRRGALFASFVRGTSA